MKILAEGIYTAPQDVEALKGIHDRLPELCLVQAEFVATNGLAYDTMPPRFGQHNIAFAPQVPGQPKRSPIVPFDNTFFKSLLGPDVAHELHPLMQAAAVLDYGFDPDLTALALVHDWGEAHPKVGDSVFGQGKTAEEEELEISFRDSRIRLLLGGSATAQAAELIAYAKHIDNPNTTEGRMFKLAERVRYMLTILRATELASFDKIHPAARILTAHQQEVLWSISSHGLYHIKHLKGVADLKPKIGDLLESNAEAIKLIEGKFSEPRKNYNTSFLH